MSNCITDMIFPDPVTEEAVKEMRGKTVVRHCITTLVILALAVLLTYAAVGWGQMLHDHTVSGGMSICMEVALCGMALCFYIIGFSWAMASRDIIYLKYKQWSIGQGQSTAVRRHARQELQGSGEL